MTDPVAPSRVKGDRAKGRMKDKAVVYIESMHSGDKLRPFQEAQLEMDISTPCLIQEMKSLY